MGDGPGGWLPWPSLAVGSQDRGPVWSAAAGLRQVDNTVPKFLEQSQLKKRLIRWPGAERQGVQRDWRLGRIMADGGCDWIMDHGSMIHVCMDEQDGA